jgi:uncharacterized membrane protein YvlD (DUF360 family)
MIDTHRRARHPRSRALARGAGRLLVVWAVEIAAFALLARVLPGLAVNGWRAAVWGVAVIGLLNALLRPVLLFVTLPAAVLSFGVASLMLNAATLLAAAHLVPGLSIASLATAASATLGLALLNTFVSGLLPLDPDGAVYRHLSRRLAMRRVTRQAEHDASSTARGLIVIEIDGLSRPALDRAMREGYMPTLARWIAEGSHRLRTWDCGLPSQTSSSQAGILYGDNRDIPAFRWYEKSERRLIVSGRPEDAAEIERRLVTGAGADGGLLRANGTSLCNMFTGGAGRSVMTVSTFGELRRDVRRSTDFYGYFVNPYTFARAFVLMGAAVAVELWGAASQRARDVRPRVRRGGRVALLRATSTILFRDLGIHMLLEDVFAGIAVNYTTFFGYDVVAHYAGPERAESLRVLRGIDARLAELARATSVSTRPYDVVVLSDHGQSSGTTFRQRHGSTLDDLIRALLRDGHTVRATAGSDEVLGHLDALLPHASARAQPDGRGRTSGPADTARGRDDDGEVVVCASGNLGLVYFTREPGRWTLETIASRHPGLIEGLVQHDGIGFVLVRSDQHGALALGRDGVHHLGSGRVDGHDPLAAFGPRSADHLRRLDGFPNVGDLVINSAVVATTGEVHAFEEQVGSHGGLGGPQTEAVLLHPSAWQLDGAEIVGAPEIHRLLRARLAS